MPKINTSLLSHSDLFYTVFRLSFNNLVMNRENKDKESFLYKGIFYKCAEDLPLSLYMKYCKLIYSEKIDKNTNGIFTFSCEL